MCHDGAVDSPAIHRARHGDEAAFQSLYRSVQPGLLRYLRVLVGDDAEDVASEAWLQAVRDLDSFRGDDQAFRAWVATIARHRALDQLRRRRRQPVTYVEQEYLDGPSGGEGTEALALAAISTETALAIIATLPREQAEAVLLRVVLGLDAAAAGRVLGKRPGAVRTATHRGLSRLAAIVAEARSPAVAEVRPGRAGGEAT